MWPSVSTAIYTAVNRCGTCIPNRGVNSLEYMETGSKMAQYENRRDVKIHRMLYNRVRLVCG